MTMCKFAKIYLTLIVAFVCGIATHAKFYALCVGIDNYRMRGIPTLRYAASDAQKMARFLKDSTSGGDIYLLQGSQATRDNILKVLRTIAKKAAQDDPIMFYYSGHGKEGGIVAYDTQSLNTLVTYREISNIYKNCPSRTKLIFADTCHSGSSRITKSKSDSDHTDGRRDIVLFLSSRPNENSLEMSRRGGLFTHFTLQGLNGMADANSDRKITARELFNYVSRNVQKVSSGKQHPMMWGNFDPDMVLMLR